MKVLVYAAGAAINGVGRLSPQIDRQVTDLRATASNRYVAAAAELGSDLGSTTRMLLDPAGRWPPESLPDTNTGDPDVLVRFAGWAEDTLPSERLLLVLSGHGVAWQDSVAQQVLFPGATRSPDLSSLVPHPRNSFGMRRVPESRARAILLDGTDRDYLSNAELGAACARIAGARGRPIDCLLMDACLMSSWETLQELAGSVASVVASIDELSAAGVQYAVSVAAFSRARGQVTPQEIAARAASDYVPVASFDTCVAVDLSGRAYADAVGGFREACEGLYRWLDGPPENASSMRAALRQASSSIVKSRSGSLADVGALAASLRRSPGLPASVAGLLDRCAGSLGNCVLARSVGRDYTGALGVSLFSPASADAYLVNRPDYLRLRLPTLSGWGAVLDRVFS